MANFLKHNYFSLLSSEKIEVWATFREDGLKGAKPVVEVDGWNVAPQVSMGVDN